MINKYQQIGLWLLIFAFFLNLTSVPNIGYQAGIKAAYNIGVYAGVVLFLIVTLSVSVNSRSIFYSSLIQYVFTLVVLFMLIGLFNSNWKNTEYTFYAMLVGLLFLLSLTQYQWNERQWFWFFYAISVLALLQILISLVQRFDTFGVLYWWTEYFPFKFHKGYLGSLQQRNMLASFLSFSVVVSFWLVLQKNFIRLHVFIKIPVFLTILLGVFIVVGSGSRVGLLGVIFGLFLLFIALKGEIKAYSTGFLIAVFLGLLGLLMAYAFPTGFANVTSKLAGVVYGTDIRLFLYGTGLNIFLENFWFGVGIGNYSASLQEFIINNALFLDKRIVNHNIERFTHPHNEFLFWMIQVGFIGCITLFFGAILLLKNWWQQGTKPFLLYLGLSFPLLLQMLVSYPLSLSATHYFLVLTILVFSLNLPVKKVTYSVSTFTVNSTRLVVFILGLWFVYTAYVALMSAFEVYYFKNRLFFYKVYPEQEKIGYFHNASRSDLYRQGVLDNMENLVVKALPIQNVYDMNQYLLWYKKQNEKSLPIRFQNYALRAEALLLIDLNSETLKKTE